jgi:hypothetical protein
MAAIKKKKRTLPSAAECETALRTLEIKREELIACGTDLPQIRRDVAYLAHVEDNVEARRELDRVAAEVAKHQSELDSIADAIAQAKDRLIIAQEAETDKVRRANAKEAIEIVAEFRQAGRDLDDALRVVVERAGTLKELLSQLHRTTASNFPTLAHLDSLGFAALMTAVLQTPWSRSLRPISPSQRREFGPTVDGWANTIEVRLRSLLSEEAA